MELIIKKIDFINYINKDCKVNMDIQKIKDTLSTKGYVVIPNIISKEKVEIAKQMFYKWQKTIPNHEELHTIIDPHGIYKFHGAGHTKHAWYLRTQPEIQEVFKKIWNCKKLITSFDGCCFISKDLIKSDKCWTHTDQAPNSKGVKCYQGYVALTSNKERTLRVYEGSHKLHELYFKDRDIKGTKNWQKIDPEYLKTIDDAKRNLEVPAGSLVLWESRTFHQNQYGKPASEERIVQYICMFPDNHEKNTKVIKNKRLKYFNERRTTSHWPAPIYVNGLQPQTYGKAGLKIDYSKVKKYNFTDREMKFNIMKLL